MMSDRDAHHALCVAQSRQLSRTLYTCWPVVTEAAHLLKRTHGAIDGLLYSIRDGKLVIVPLTDVDVGDIGVILRTYRDQGFDFADACLMHLSEREGIDSVFTIDHRHFSVFRKRDGKPLTLLPSVA